MFKSRYLLSDVARVLNRSVASLKRDAALGLLRVRASSASRVRPGAGEVYSISLGDLVRYLGKARAYAAFGTRTGRKEAVAAALAAPIEREAKYKKCRICGMLKPVSEFPREASETHWLAAECSRCRRIYGL